MNHPSCVPKGCKPLITSTPPAGTCRPSSLKDQAKPGPHPSHFSHRSHSSDASYPSDIAAVLKTAAARVSLPSVLSSSAPTPSFFHLPPIPPTVASRPSKTHRRSHE